MVRPPVNYDVDVLRTFVTGIDLGSYAKAAERLGRSPSALSLQLRKLEDQAGQTLLRKQGRGLILTEAGEVLMTYARRILELNDEARLALDNLAGLDGWVRVGVPQDFAETWLPQLLARFERAYPNARVEARVERGSRMIEAVDNGSLDMALTWGKLDGMKCDIVGHRRLAWIGTDGGRQDRDGTVALVAFDAPCAFRARAVQSLDAAGLLWRQVFVTSSLAGMWAAVSAGLGIAVRTAERIPGHLRELEPSGLPDLGSIELALHRSPSVSQAARVFTELLVEAVYEQN